MSNYRTKYLGEKNIKSQKKFGQIIVVFGRMKANSVPHKQE
jgi:hypothetical protein